MAVAVAIDGFHEKGGGQELGLTEGAGPRADQPVEGNVAVLEDFECGKQLFPEEPVAATLAGPGQQRADQRAGSHRPAVIRFDAPHGHDRLPVDAGLGFDGGQNGIPGGHPAHAVGDPLGIDHRGEVVPEQQREFGLVAVGEKDGRVGGEAGGSGGPGRVDDAGRPGGAPNDFQAAGQASGWVGCRGPGDQAGDERRVEQGPDYQRAG